jgi:hypothetical protein
MTISLNESTIGDIGTSLFLKSKGVHVEHYYRSIDPLNRLFRSVYDAGAAPPYGTLGMLSIST